MDNADFIFCIIQFLLYLLIDVNAIILYNVVCSDIDSLKLRKSVFSKGDGYEKRLLRIPIYGV